MQQVKLPEPTRHQMEMLLEELALYTGQRKRIEEKIRAYVKTASHRIQEVRELVQTIPGVSEITADVVVSELGDLERFSSQKAACSYAGLVPGHRQSADRMKSLPVTKNGSRWLRWILVEAA